MCTRKASSTDVERRSRRADQIENRAKQGKKWRAETRARSGFREEKEGQYGVWSDGAELESGLGEGRKRERVRWKKLVDVARKEARQVPRWLVEGKR